jgi:hypothetical protein
VTGTSPIVSSGGTTPAISCPTCGTGTVTVVFSGTQALGTSAITSNTCASTISVSATGVASTDNIQADFNTNPTGLTGYAGSILGILTIYKWPTTNTINLAVCNWTAASITPSAATLNLRVSR